MLQTPVPPPVIVQTPMPPGVVDPNYLVSQIIPLIGVIPEDENVIVASNRGQPLALDPKNRAGQAFQNIARRLMGERVPFLDLNPQNMFQRILGRR